MYPLMVSEVQVQVHWYKYSSKIEGIAPTPAGM